MTNDTCYVPDCEKRRKPERRYCSMHCARLSRNGTLDYVGNKPIPIEQAIEARVLRGPGCWTWTGYVNRDGYAKLRRGKDNISIHRWMYERMVGELVDGMVLDHACRNRGCVNPAHLRQVTTKQNVEHFTTAVRSNNTSGYRGVRFHRASGLWMASVKSGDVVQTTYHRGKLEAAKAAREMRLVMHTHNDLDIVRGV